MTPADKTAKRLVTMYFQIQEPYFRMPDLRLAKKDSLICVDEKIKTVQEVCELTIGMSKEQLLYLTELLDVKQAINKL